MTSVPSLHAGMDAGMLDPIVMGSFEVAWTQGEGDPNSDPLRGDLVLNNAGQVLWFVSSSSKDSSAADFNVPSGYVVSLVPATGQYVQSDGGVLVLPDGGPSRLRGVPLQADLPSFFSPPNACRTGGGFQDAARLALSELLVDGGPAPALPDGGLRGFGSAIGQVPLVPGTLEREFLTFLNGGAIAVAAGRLTLVDPASLAPPQVRDAYVRRSSPTSPTELVFSPTTSAAERVEPGFACAQLPTDVVTTLGTLDGGSADRLITLSVCNGVAHVLAYSGRLSSVPGGSNNNDLNLGTVSSARMAIAGEGTPRRAPFVAVVRPDGVFIVRLEPDGTATLGPTGLPASAKLLVQPTANPVSIEALAVNDANEPLVALRTTPNTMLSIVRNGSLPPVQVTPASGVVLIQLSEDLWYRSVGPLAGNASLRVSSAAIAGSTSGQRRLLLSVTCDIAGSSVCERGRGPALLGVIPP